jgi:Rieske Fe-S protein
MDSCFDRREFLRCAGLGFLVGLPVVLTAGTQAGAERRYPIPAGDSVNVDRGAQLIVVRYQNHVYAFNLSCPHQNAAVKWLAKDQRFQCTKHDSKYTPVGVYTSGRATRNMDRLPVRRDGDAVFVDTSKMIQSDKDPAAWTNATVAL